MRIRREGVSCGDVRANLRDKIGGRWKDVKDCAIARAMRLAPDCRPIVACGKPEIRDPRSRTSFAASIGTVAGCAPTVYNGGDLTSSLECVKRVHDGFGIALTRHQSR